MALAPATGSPDLQAAVPGREIGLAAGSFTYRISKMKMTRDCPTWPAGVRRLPLFFLWTVALAVVLLVLLHASLFFGKGLVPADGILNYPPWNQTARRANYLLSDQSCAFIPQHEFVHQQFLRGHFPLWDPYLECGLPNLGSIQGALLFPVNLLLMPLDPFYASGVAAFLKLFLAGLFTMLYLRRLGVSDAAAKKSPRAWPMPRRSRRNWPTPKRNGSASWPRPATWPTR